MNNPQCSNCGEACKENNTCQCVQPIPTTGHPHAFNLSLFLSGLALIIAFGGIFTLNMIRSNEPVTVVTISSSENELEQVTTEKTVTTSVTIASGNGEGLNMSVTILE
ncbi:MAG: hypothetical protein Q8P30_02195 [Candidatus Uhrbacteria bacterium]|nr:hypothetical protein [Candidatus Uhrbacteria bacterium]